MHVTHLWVKGQFVLGMRGPVFIGQLKQIGKQRLTGLFVSQYLAQIMHTRLVYR